MRKGCMGRSTREDILGRLIDIVVEYEEEKVEGVCREAIDAGVDPNEAIIEGLAAGMRKVGDLYDRQEYGIPEVLLCADTLNRGMEILKPHVKSDAAQLHRRILIATVEGDIHSIGKNIVKLMLEVGGFDVRDLGEDVPVTRVMDELKSGGGDMVALSTMMTTTLASMRKIIDGVREKFPETIFLVGGASVTPDTAQGFGAQGYAENATEAVRIAREISGVHS
jgi:methanogenic corrinoid protein MtbC1